MISFAWKECPSGIDENKKYTVDKENPRISTKKDNGAYSTIIGSTPLPLNAVVSWHIKMKNLSSNGAGTNVGVAPADIDQNENDNHSKCGWYLYCYTSGLCSGPPCVHKEKPYGPRREWGKYVSTGDSVGVAMDTARGELSFFLGGVDMGVAFEGIPLDRPLVPCVLLLNAGETVEFDPTEVKETELNKFIPAPSEIATKSNTSDTITIKWEAVKDASFYQVEVEGRRGWEGTLATKHTINGLEAATGYKVRVRTVRGREVGLWSNYVTEFTQKPYFSSWGWRDCPGDVIWWHKYSVDEENPKVATKDSGNSYSTVVGNTPLPPGKVTSWGVKVLKAMYGDGLGIYVGVAPADICQSERENYKKCGWYFDCYWSKLFSGKPQCYFDREYGPRKREGKYVRKGDIVGVEMDMAKGELSFGLKGVNLGVAYEGIPLDKPLVPCVLLLNVGDSVKLVTKEDMMSDAPEKDKDCIIS